MNSISKDVALEFCKLCNWVYESWVMHKLLFDENPNHGENIDKAKALTYRLSIITQEYCLLQISKLHDPPIMRDSLNLTIDYIVRFGDWGTEQRAIVSLQATLFDLWQRLKSARNKALAHNDLETIMSTSVFGSFPKGLDDKYFGTLQDLVNAVHAKWLHGPYPFNDLARADVKEFLALLEKA